ncbi:hypothetical protein DMN91_005496 [Ooceraea biroi]|uniref:Uncharacterized protein n=1 Tax=Ooceraea biroi TaxID=2015173 RepID=A0A3L8DLN3_OOCBI|nr:hypothetical protein DMN91_005496 [Ooceraea biroi]
METTAPRPEENAMKKRRRYLISLFNRWGDVVATPHVDVRRIRILGRRYNLTRTGYKYLEIGIDVPLTADAATVNIALGDTTCKEIMLTAEMWKGLVGSRTLICDNLARANSEHGSPPPVYLDDLAMRFAIINGQPTIRLDTPSGRLTLSEPTVHYRCSDCGTASSTPSPRWTAPSGALSLNCVPSSTSGVEDSSSARRAISSSADFDRSDLLDCELLVVLFGNI